MILSPTSTKIQSIYNPDVTYVTTDEPEAESVGRIMQKYDLVAIPVVDSIWTSCRTNHDRRRG